VRFSVRLPGQRWGFLPTTSVRTFRCTACGYLESYARPEARGSRGS
jgi:hypothetical protein